jgi:hypothetical protein
MASKFDFNPRRARAMERRRALSRGLFSMPVKIRLIQRRRLGRPARLGFLRTVQRMLKNLPRTIRTTWRWILFCPAHARAKARLTAQFRNSAKRRDPVAIRERRLLSFRPSGNAELDNRRLLAIDAGGHILGDPISKDPAYAEIFKAAWERVDNEIGRPYKFGSCHARWALLQKILKEEHGITWYTPNQMNPGVIFD